ncbi:MAG: tetratricopeptide repeat protein [Acidobacteriota bacterium]|nr:tetratricopeptide repeat protein [Acidobacteriota bacterium]
MKREERHHLKENDFATMLNRTGDGVRSHSRGVSVAAVLVAVALVLVGGYFFWRSNRQEKAGAMLADATATLQAPVQPPAIGTPAVAGTFPNERARTEAALPKLLAAADAFPSTSAGIQARYLAASTLVELARYPEAIQRYQEIIDRDSKGLYGQTSRIGLANAASLAGEHDRAITELQAMSGDTSGTIPADAVLAQLARVYDRAGRTAEATDTWKRIKNEFPESVYQQEATQRSGN